MGKPIIGITSTETKVSPDGLMIHSSVSRHFARAVIKAGGVPIHIPVCSPDMAESYVSMIDRLILSGGQDVQPSLYQQDNDKDTSLYFPERDDFEFALRLSKKLFARKNRLWEFVEVFNFIIQFKVVV